jgi:peptidoglycan/xylan/chitin deacetylase (PgdA/CDA1 family)
MKLPNGWYVFYYHDVSGDDRVPRSVRSSPQRFKSEVSFLKDHFEMIPFSEGLSLLREDRNDKLRASICFDDGYRSVLDNALPTLVAERVPHILFLNAAFLDGEGATDAVIARRLGKGMALRDKMNPRAFPPLWDRIKDETDWRSLFLDRESLNSFPTELTQFGNHTRRHYWLAGLSWDEQEAEIAGNHEQLKNLTGYQSVLALPFGTSDCFDVTTLSIIDRVHCGVVVKAVGGISHRREAGRLVVERIGLSDEKPRFDDLLLELVTKKKTVGSRIRKLSRNLSRILHR